MRAMKIAGLIVLAMGMLAGVALCSLSQATQAQAGTAKQLGTIKNISGGTLVLAPDNGAPVTVIMEGTTRIVRIAPGDKDLKNAVPIAPRDLQAGDRILVRGKQGDSGQLTASAIIVMKLADLETKQQREREDWQKRGVAGLVTAVDDASKTISISVSSPGGKKTVAVHTSKDTVLRRYAPDSVRFDDAHPGTLAQIQPGDQLRARGTRSTDGAEFSAEEIVTGSFRNIAGNVASVDAASGVVTVVDSATKKTIAVKITPDSQLRSLPPEMAKRVAMRLSGAGAAGATPPGAPKPGTPATGPGSPNAGFRPDGMGAARGGAESGPQRRGDIQQLFNHLPPLSIGEMQKGDTIMLVATEGTSAGVVTAIKLLDGVEPLLAAAPKNGRDSMTLSPWSLGGGGQGDEDSN